MTDYKFQTFDVFTKSKFAGNPLAVVFDAEGLSTEQMQTITAEFNLSETTFILPPKDPGHTARVRIFTLGYEMPFAGHPTVGTSIAIARARGLSGSLKLELNAGLFDVELRGDDYAQFTNPNIPVEVGDAPSHDKLAPVFGLAQGDIETGAHRARLCGSGGVNYLYVCASLEAVQRAVLNRAHYSALGLDSTVGVYLYAHGGVDKGATYHARMFAPDAGLEEDPATGSAASGLPAQIVLAQREMDQPLNDGPHHWVIEQGYEMGRKSQIMAQVDIEDGALKSVQIGGHAAQIQSGILSV